MGGWANNAEKTNRIRLGAFFRLSLNKDTNAMARLKGILPIVGKMGPFSMYYLNGALVVRRRAGPDAKAIQTNENYAGLHQHNVEFGRVSKASKLMRYGFRSLIKEMADSQIHGRMTNRLSTIKNLDPAPKGERTVEAGMLSPNGIPGKTGRALLHGFECNPYGSLDVTLLNKAKEALETGAFVVGYVDGMERLAMDQKLEIRVVWMKVDFKQETNHAFAENPLFVGVDLPFAISNMPEELAALGGTLFLVVAVRVMLKDGVHWRVDGRRNRYSLTVV